MRTEINITISPERYLELLGKEEIANQNTEIVIVPTTIVGEDSEETALKIIYNKQKLPSIQDIVIYECEQYEKRLSEKGYQFYDSNNDLHNSLPKVYVRDHSIVFWLKKIFKL